MKATSHKPSTPAHVGEAARASVQASELRGVPKVLEGFADAIQTMTSGVNELNAALTSSSGIIDESLFTSVVNTIEDQTKICESYLQDLGSNAPFLNGAPVDSTERFPRPKQSPGDRFISSSQLLFDILNSQYLMLNSTIKEANEEYSRTNDLASFQAKVQKCYRNYIQIVSSYLGGVRECLRLADSFRSSYQSGYAQISSLASVGSVRLRSLVYVRPVLESQQEHAHDQFVHVLDDCTLSCYHPTIKFSRELSVEDIIPPESSLEEIYEHFSPLMSVVRNRGNVVLLAHGESGSGKSHCLFGPGFHDGVVSRLIEDMISLVQEKESNTRVYLRFFEVGREGYLDLYTGACVKREDQVKQVSVRSLPEITNYYERFLVKRESRNALVVQATIYTNTLAQGQMTAIELVGSEKLRGLSSTEGFLPNFHNLLLGEKVDRTPLYALLSQCLEDPQSVLSFFVTLNPCLKSSEETQVNAQFLSLLRPGRVNPLLSVSTTENPSLRALKSKFFDALNDQFAATMDYKLAFDQNEVLKSSMDRCLAEMESFAARDRENAQSISDVEVEITNYKELIGQLLEREKSLQQSVLEALASAESANEVNWKKRMNPNLLEEQLAYERELAETEKEEMRVRNLRAKVAELKRRLKQGEPMTA